MRDCWTLATTALRCINEKCIRVFKYAFLGENLTVDIGDDGEGQIRWGWNRAAICWSLFEGSREVLFKMSLLFKQSEYDWHTVLQCSDGGLADPPICRWFQALGESCVSGIGWELRAGEQIPSESPHKDRNPNVCICYDRVLQLSI